MPPAGVKDGTATLTMVPHCGRIALDWHGGAQVLTHTVCLSRQVAPAEGEWELEYDDDGFAALVRVNDNEEQEPILVESFLTRQLYTSSTGERFLVNTRAGGDQVIESLTQKMRDFLKGAIEIQLDGQAIKLDLFYLTWPRSACHLVWSAVDLYDHLGMKSYKGERSKWVYGSWQRWKDIVKSLVDGEHFLKSVKCVCADEGLTSESFFLPVSCMTTTALVILLSVWCRASIAQGGLRDEGSRQKAKELLLALVKGAHVIPSALDLVFHAAYTIRWPRPALESTTQQTLTIHPGGNIDCSKWVELCESGVEPKTVAESLQWEWLALFRDSLDEKGMINLGELILLEDFVMIGEAFPMWIQLVAHLSQRIEVVYMRSKKPGNEVEGELQACELELSDSWDAREIDKTAMIFVSACKESTKGFKAAGMAVDKFSGRGLNLQNGILCMPDNTGFELAPQVVSGAAEEDQDDLVASAAAAAKRHEAFLGGGKSTSWRPQKKHRAASAKVLQMMDNQLRVSSVFGGLAYFRPHRYEDGQGRHSERMAPLDALGGRLRPGGRHAGRRLRVVLQRRDEDLRDALPRPVAHGQQRLLVDHRRLGLKAGDAAADDCHEPVPWTRRHAPTTAAVGGDHGGALPCASAGDFAFLQGDAAPDPRRVAALREGGGRGLRAHSVAAHGGGFLLPSRRREGLHGALPRDRRQRAGLACEVAHLPLRGVGDGVGTRLRQRQDGAQGESTSRRHITDADRTVRSCGSNAVAISFAVLSDTNNLRVLATVVKLSEPTMSWMGAASRELRDVSSSRAWLLRQVRHEIADSVNDTLAVLGHEDFLRKAQFLTTTSSALCHLSNDDLVCEDEAACLAGDFALNMCKARLRRSLFMLSGPAHRFVLVLGTPAEADSYAADLKCDFELFEKASALPAPSALLRQYLSRSPFKLYSVLQVVESFKSYGWRVRREQTDLADKRFATLMQSQAVEDLNNHQKNFRQQGGWGGLYRRPLNAMCSTIRGMVLPARHKFKSPDLSAAHKVEMKPLERMDVAAVQTPSLPVKKVATCSQAAAYFSPNAENFGIGIADLAVLRALDRTGQMGQVSLARGGWWCDASHHIVFRPSGRAENKWFLPLYHYKDSGVIALEVEVCQMQCARDVVRFLKFVPVKQPIVLAIFDPADYEVLRFTWRSWAWQVSKLGKTRLASVEPGIRAIVDTGAPMSVLKAAAKSAWWQLSRNTLEMVAETEGVELERNCDLLEVVSKLTMHALGITAEASLRILEQRLIAPLRAAEASEGILQVDEAAACLREDDWKVVKAEKARSEEKAREATEFRNAFRSRAAASRRQSASGSKPKVPKIPYKGPKKLPTPTEHVAQGVAKSLLPPESYLWRARGGNSWNARFRDWPSRSARDNAHGGEFGALVVVLRHAWRQYLDSSGLEASSCPVADLFGDEGAEVVQASVGGAAGSAD